MKKLFILLSLSILNSASEAKSYSEIMDGIKKKMQGDNSPCQLSAFEEFVCNFGKPVNNANQKCENETHESCPDGCQRGLQHSRVTRWFNVNSIADQEKIIKYEKYNWHHDSGSGFPNYWPTAIHCFSKEIDNSKQFLAAAVFREKKNNVINRKFDNSVYATAMADIEYYHPDFKEFYRCPGVLEYGYNIKTGILFHRCFRGIGWKDPENSLAPFNDYIVNENGIKHWNDNLLECEFKNNRINGLTTRLLKSPNVKKA
jgi:hypothetical protein